MRTWRPMMGVAGLVLAVSLVCIWFYPSIQDFMASNTLWNGMRRFSNDFNAVNLDSLEELPDVPARTVLVVIPYLDYTDGDLARIKGFVSAGGTLLLLDDYGHGNAILAALGSEVRFAGDPLLDPVFGYRNQWLPRITDFAPGAREAGVSLLTLNHATALTGCPPNRVMAWSSGAGFLDRNGDSTWNADERRGPFPVVAQFAVGRGTVTVVADASVLINSMFGRDDSLAFTRYLIGDAGRVLVDYPHLARSPLDVSKQRLDDVRQALATPPAVVVLTAIVFAAVARYALRKGNAIAE